MGIGMGTRMGTGRGTGMAMFAVWNTAHHRSACIVGGAGSTSTIVEWAGSTETCGPRSFI